MKNWAALKDYNCSLRSPTLYSQEFLQERKILQLGGSGGGKEGSLFCSIPLSSTTRLEISSYSAAVQAHPDYILESFLGIWLITTPPGTPLWEIHSCWHRLMLSRLIISVDCFSALWHGKIQLHSIFSRNSTLYNSILLTSISFSILNIFFLNLEWFIIMA